nr:cytochrome p450 CYP3049B2 [Brachionus angularis]
MNKILIKCLKSFGLIASLGTGFLIYQFLNIYLNRRKYRHIPGPKTKGIVEYFFGNISDIEKAVKDGKVLTDLFVEWHEKYGEVFKYQLSTDIIVVTSNQQAIKECLVVKNYPKVKPFAAYPLGERFLGHGLVTELDNNVWKHRRTMFNPGFHRKVLMTFVLQFNTKANVLLEKLELLSQSNKPITLFAEINHATLDAIANIAFDMNIDSINNQEIKFNLYINNILIAVNKYFQNPLEKFKPINITEKQDIKKMIRYLRQVGKEKINQRIKAFKNGENLPNDILTAILNNSKEDYFDLEVMIDDFITFFIAGQETTANTLAFCFLELGKNPNIIAKIEEEIDRVLGEKTEITFEEINELKYCSAVFKESLRLWPPVPRITRKCLDEMEINGLKIPANSIMNLSTYLNSRLEKYFENPLEFKPERFIKDKSLEQSQISNYSYFPFSLGPRNCIGLNFAQIEGIVMIAKILQRFEFELDPNQSMQIEQALTLRPKDGTKCFLKLKP